MIPWMSLSYYYHKDTKEMVHIQSFGYIPSLLFQRGHFFSALLKKYLIYVLHSYYKKESGKNIHLLEFSFLIFHISLVSNKNWTS